MASIIFIAINGKCPPILDERINIILRLLYKRNKENLELLGWTVVETFEEEYFIVPTAMFFLQDKLVG